MGNRKGIKTLTGARAVIKLNGQNIPIFNPGQQVNVQGAYAQYSGNVINVSGTFGGMITVTVDPLLRYDEDQLKKHKIGPIINFLKLLKTFGVTKEDDLNNFVEGILHYNKRHRKVRLTPPKNKYLKQLFERENKKSRWR